MNLPNKLTILRMILIPVFMILLMTGHSYISAVVFVAASITDALDGHIARKYNLISNFGKIMDPLADKLLVTAALLCLVQLGHAAAWMVFVILARELLIVSLRAVAASQGIVIAASKWGKLKTISQMVAVILLLMENWPFGWDGFPLADIIMWIAVILTVISGVDYIIKNKDVFKG
ncbi:MAG: CDP-diacylglycerol--glycerol-3-phosphate 3-phosphatidyltransferase [Bacillota bacterium]|nr:CDP-diacylglycerol--glycerol-3-phosphate 3-phosphatidyltransferase [Bacillota bacterium]